MWIFKGYTIWGRFEKVVYSWRHVSIGDRKGRSWFSSGDPFKNVITASRSQLLHGLFFSTVYTVAESFFLIASSLLFSVGSVQGVLLLFAFLVWQHLPAGLQLGPSSTELWVWFSAACYLSPPGRAAGPSHTTCPAKACSLCSRSVSYLLTHLVVLERNHFLMLLLSFSSGL